jgi:hypothetical protein
MDDVFNFSAQQKKKKKKEKYLREPIFDRTEPAQNIVFIIDKHYAVLSS